MYVLSIDIGIIHFALSTFSVNADYTLESVEWIDMIDITRYVHKNVTKEECTLYHTKTMSDWLDHTIQENRVFFDNADVIIVERQPPTSPFIAIEQLIFSKYRAKTQLISPKNVHTYLRISHLDYEARKSYSEQIAERILPEHFKEKIKTYERAHDIADSICMFMYWLDKNVKEYNRQLRQKQLRDIKILDGMSVFEKLEKFRYIKI
jgi:hypothetical protein